MDEAIPRARPRWRRLLRILLAVALGLTVAAGGYVAYAAIRAARPVTLPAPGGSYAVGRATVDWTDTSRTDPLAPRPGLPRELSVWLWYPAAPAPGSPRAPYAPGAWAGLHIGGPPGWGETRFEEVRDHSVADAPVAAGRFPVIVLEPGMGLAVPQYTTIAEDLASHGYLVAGVTPTYSANLTVLNGHTVPSTVTGNPREFDTATGSRLVPVWAADARFTADRAAALDTVGRFTGHVEAGSTLYIGHSFGGAASLEACRADPHCAGAADLDGTQFGTVVHSGLSRPMLLIGSDGSCVTGVCRPANADGRAARDAATALLAASTGPVWCYQVNGATHFNFSDYGAYYLAAPIRAIVGLGPVNGDRALTITAAYLAAFADHVTHARPEPLLTGPTPNAQVTAQRCAP